MVASAEWIKISTLIFGGSTVAMIVILNLYSDTIKMAELEERNVNANLTSSQNITDDGSPRKRVWNDPGPILPQDVKYCNKIAALLAKRYLKKIRPCNTEHKKKYPQSEVFQKYYQCAIRCVFKSAELLNENYQMTDETIWRFIEVQFPQKYHDIVHRLGYQCVSKFMPLMDGEDEYCTAHGDFLKCLQNYATDVCQAQTDVSV